MNFWEETHGCLLSKNVDHEKPYRSSISKVQKEVWYQASLPKKLDEWGIVFASLSSKKPSNSSSRTGWPWEFKLLPSMRKNHRNQPFLVKTAVGNLWMEFFGSPLFGAPSLLDSTPFFHTGGPFGKSWSGVRQCLRLGDMVCSHGELQQLTKSIRFCANMGRNMLSSGRNMLSSWVILQGVWLCCLKQHPYSNEDFIWFHQDFIRWPNIDKAQKNGWRNRRGMTNWTKHFDFSGRRLIWRPHVDHCRTTRSEAEREGFGGNPASYFWWFFFTDSTIESLLWETVKFVIRDSLIGCTTNLKYYINSGVLGRCGLVFLFWVSVSGEQSRKAPVTKLRFDSCLQMM